MFGVKTIGRTTPPMNILAQCQDNGFVCNFLGLMPRGGNIDSFYCNCCMGACCRGECAVNG